MEHSISIIIPAWNEESIILQSSKFLQKLILPFKYSEIIFIAGGSDNTYKICNEIEFNNFNKTITIKQQPDDYKSGALIKGFCKSTGDIITIIDADTLVSSNLMIQITKSLNKFDAVNCNYYPLVNKGFWYDYCIINKLIWSKDPEDLPSLYGGSPITLKRKILEDIGIKNLFSNKSTAGVDHYMGLVLKKKKIKIGFIEDSKVFTPRPNCLIDFIKDYTRWFTAFFQLHQNDKKIIYSTLISSILKIFFPFRLLLFNFKKVFNIRVEPNKKVRYYIVLFFSEYILSILRINSILRNSRKRSKFIGHFKGIRYR